MTKLGRNDPCPCGSGKKYKKCCELKNTASRKLTAHKLEGGDIVNRVSNISGLFQQVTFVPPKVVEEEPLLEEKKGVEDEGKEISSTESDEKT